MQRRKHRPTRMPRLCHLATVQVAELAKDNKKFAAIDRAIGKDSFKVSSRRACASPERADAIPEAVRSNSTTSDAAFSPAAVCRPPVELHCRWCCCCG